jgi:hypothetical protein
VEEEIDAQIEQLLSAKRTVRNIDAASAANIIGNHIQIHNNFPVLLVADQNRFFYSS